MSIRVGDGTTDTNVDATSKGLVVQNPKTVTQAGYAGLAAVRDPGAVTGSVNAILGDVSIDNRTRTGVDTLLFSDHFSNTAQNSAIWQNNLTTMTLTYASGFANLNAGASTASGAFAVLKTYRVFSVNFMGQVRAEFRGFLTQTPQTNNIVAIGIGTPGTTAAPTDGAYFLYSSTGVLNAVVNYNGTTLLSSALTAPSANATHEFVVIVGRKNAEFWIDGVLQAVLLLPTNAPTGFGSPTQNAFVQNTNTGVTGAAQAVKISTVNVWQLDIGTNKLWPHQMAGMGLGGYQGQNGATMGTTALYGNSTNPTAAVPSNTAAALGSGLGGNFWHTNTLAVNTDGIISSVANTTGSVTNPPRNLYVVGVKIDTIVQTLCTSAGGQVFCWSAAFGHTSVSLATTETATAKAPRRIALGVQGMSGSVAVGTVLNQINTTFQVPLLVQPGEFFATVVKNIGSVGTAGTLAHMITIDSYWE